MAFCRGVNFPFTGNVRVTSAVYWTHSAAASITTRSPLSAVALANGDPGPPRIDRRLLRAEHEIVNGLRPRGDLPVPRKRARDVGGVLAPPRGGVDPAQVPVLGLPAFAAGGGWGQYTADVT